MMYEVGEISRFKKVGNFASYCRLVKTARLSAGKRKGSGNARNGNPYLSWAFSEAAHFAVRYHLPAKKYFQRKRSKTNGIIAIRALAHKLAALSLLGDEAGVAALVDLESMIHIERFEGGGGFADASALNTRLAAHILNHPTLGAERTTTNGMDTGEILRSAEPEVLALVELVDAAIERMMDGLTLDPTHPFPASRPPSWYLSGWGVRMWRGGYQIPHYHKDAWISGVYYVQLPPVVSDADGSQQGWIEFGRGPDDIYHDARPPIRRIQPEEGKLIAFPSYFWHRTLPFDDDHERLCISFNVVPAQG